MNLACPPGIKPLGANGCGNTIIKVKNNYLDRKGKSLPLKFEVTGGRLIENGSDLVWDLNVSKPGTYLITAFDSRKGKALKLGTKAVTAKECDMCPCGFCMCPSEIMITPFVNNSIIEILSSIKAGEEIVFVANVTGLGGDVSYKWKILGGKVLEGQGTSRITVRIDSDARQLVASLELVGLCADCPNSTSKTIDIEKK